MKSKDDSNYTQVLWVLFGSISGFLFTIGSSIILSRYFEKEDYGTYKQVMYVYNTLLVVFTLGLPKAYSFFLPRIKIEESRNLIKKVSNILLLAGGIMGVLLFFLADLISVFLKNEELLMPLKMFSIVPLLILPTMGLEGILASFKKTKFLAIYNILSKVFMLLCVVLPVMYYKATINVAIVGFLISSFITMLLANFFKYSQIKSKENKLTSVTYKDILEFTFPIMLASFWGILIQSSDQFFISRYFGEVVFADFSNGSLEIPFVGMIISSASVVLAPIFSKIIYENEENFQEKVIAIWHNVFNKTMLLIYPIVVFFICFSDIIMIFLFGSNYANSGDYFRIKVIVNFFTLISYGPLLLAIGGNRYYYKVHMYGALILIILEFLAVKIFNSPYAVTWVSVFCQIGRIIALLYFISNYFNLSLLKLIPLKNIMNVVIPSFIIIIVSKSIIINFVNNYINILLLNLVVYLIFYSIWAYYKKLDYMSILLPLIKKIKKK